MSAISNKPKILMLLHGLTRSGAPILAHSIATSITSTYALSVFSMLDGPLREDFGSIVPTGILWPGGSLPRRAWGLCRREGLFRSLDIRNFRLLYINSIALVPILKKLASTRIPTIMHVHEMGSMVERVADECPGLMNRAETSYIAVSDAVAASLIHRLGVEKSKITVINAFVRSDVLNYSGAKSRPASHVPRFVVGGAGLPSWCKGTTLWLLMAAELRRVLGDLVRFVWVGAPQERTFSSFRAEARLLGLDGVVTFIPPTATPLEYYAQFDVFAMTSWEDSCPLVVLENMALGKPVICFAGGGGSREVLGEAGIVVDEFCPTEMARQIAGLATQPAVRARLGALGRDRVRENFTDLVQVPKIMQLISSIM